MAAPFLATGAENWQKRKNKNAYNLRNNDANDLKFGMVSFRVISKRSASKKFFISH